MGEFLGEKKFWAKKKIWAENNFKILKLINKSAKQNNFKIN